MLQEQQQNEQRRKEALRDSNLFSSTEIENRLNANGSGVIPDSKPKASNISPQRDVDSQSCRVNNEQFRVDEPCPDAFRSGINVEELARGLDELKQFVDSGMSFGEVPQVK